MELLFNNSPNGEIFAGGFSIKSLGIPSVMTQSGGGTEDFSQTYAVPFGLVTTNFKPFQFQAGGSNTSEVIADDLHKKLLELVREKRAKQSKTKKNHKSKKNTTKKTYE